MSIAFVTITPKNILWYCNFLALLNSSTKIVAQPHLNRSTVIFLQNTSEYLSEHILYNLFIDSNDRIHISNCSLTKTVSLERAPQIDEKVERDYERPVSSYQ